MDSQPGKIRLCSSSFIGGGGARVKGKNLLPFGGELFYLTLTPSEKRFKLQIDQFLPVVTAHRGANSFL